LSLQRLCSRCQNCVKTLSFGTLSPKTKRLVFRRSHIPFLTGDSL